MNFDRLRRTLQTIFEEMMSEYEERRKGVTRQFTFCVRCHYVHEYRLDEQMVFIRCRSCKHVHSKRDMTAREHTDILHYETQQPIDTTPARQGENVMENDGKKFLSNKERTAYVKYCENMTQYYRADKNVQFQFLDDWELVEYVEAYKYDEAMPSILDEVCDGKG